MSVSSEACDAPVKPNADTNNTKKPTNKKGKNSGGAGNGNGANSANIGAATVDHTPTAVAQSADTGADKKHKNDKNAKKQTQQPDALNTSTSNENVSDDLKHQSAKVKKLKSKKEKKIAKKQQQNDHNKSNVSSISEDNYHTNDKPLDASNNANCKPEHIKATKEKFNAKNSHAFNESATENNKKVFSLIYYTTSTNTPFA